MAGLLDRFFGGPDQTQALGLLGVGMMNGGFGQGAGLAMSHLAEAPLRRQKALLAELQMQNLQSEVEARKLKMDQARKDEEMFQSIFGPQPAQQGQLGSGSFGIMPTAAGVPSVPASGGQRIPNLTFDQLAMLKRRGIDLTDIHKYANDPLKMEAGSTYVNRVTGKREYMPKLPDGATVENGRVGAMPGYMDLLAQTTLAQQAPKTLLESAGRLNLRDNPDGTKSPVSELQENPTLQSVLGNVLGRPAQPSAGSVPPVAQPSNRPVVSPNAQRTADAESVLMMREELKNPNLPPAHRQAIQREIARIEQASAGPGFPAPSMIRNPQGYGKTTAQETAAAAEKEQAIQAARDMAEQRKGIMQSGFAAPANIAKYERIGALLENVDGGALTATGTQLASTMNSLGFKIDKNLPNKEAAAAIANEAALQLRNPSGGAGMPGALSDKDREFLTGMTPNAAQSAEGRKLIITSYVALQRRNQQVAQFARNYEKKYGKLDNGFFDQLQAWSNANPMFGPK